MPTMHAFSASGVLAMCYLMMMTRLWTRGPPKGRSRGSIEGAHHEQCVADNVPSFCLCVKLRPPD